MSTEFLIINVSEPTATVGEQIAQAIGAGKHPSFALPTSLRDKFLVVFNDDPRVNTVIEILESAERTDTNNSELVENRYGKGAIILIDVTAKEDTPSIVAKVQGEINGVFYDILTTSAITDVSQTILHVHPSITAEANLKAAAALPRNWRVIVEHADADPITYSINATTLL